MTIDKSIPKTGVLLLNLEEKNYQLNGRAQQELLIDMGIARKCLIHYTSLS